MKVWITKYALTRGVLEGEAEKLHIGEDGIIEVKPLGYFHKPDWHDSAADAQNRVATMIEKRLATLEQQHARFIRLQTKFIAMGLDAVIKTLK